MRNVVFLLVAVVLCGCGGGDQELQPEVRTAVQSPQLPPPAVPPQTGS